MERHPASSNVRRERYGNEAGRRAQDHAERWLDDHEAMRPGVPIDADDPRRADDAIAIDEVIERLSRDMSTAIHRAPMDEQREIRSYATELVREDAAPSTARRLPTGRARLSFFAVAVCLAAAGALLAFLFPPAGIACFLMAGVAAVLAVILGPGEAPTERTSGPPAT